MTLSTIAIGDADRELMKSIAEAGEGGYRDVRNISELPKIMADEVRQTQAVYRSRTVSANHQ